MTDEKNPNDSLGDFLRTHAPRVPDAPDSLEDSVLRAIRSVPVARTAVAAKGSSRLFAFALLAACALVWVVSSEEAPAPDSSSLEFYMETSFEGAMVSDQEQLGYEPMLAELDRDFP